MTIAAIIFAFFIFAIAAATFFVLKRTIKMAFRAAIVALILLIAVVGGVSLWWFSADNTPVKTPPTNIKKTR